MSKKNKARKKILDEPTVIRNHTDHQQGESCAVKEVLHGNRADQVHDGQLHRIHEKFKGVEIVKKPS